jgi:hypothetical protein
MRSEAIKKMLNEIRQAIGRCNEPEREVMEELMGEAEGWKMRLEELDEEEDE